MGSVTSLRERPPLVSNRWMTLVSFDKTLGRVYFLGARIHHGAIGVALTVMALEGTTIAPIARALLVAAGISLVIDDFHDFPWTSDSYD